MSAECPRCRGRKPRVPNSVCAFPEGVFTTGDNYACATMDELRLLTADAAVARRWALSDQLRQGETMRQKRFTITLIINTDMLPGGDTTARLPKLHEEMTGVHETIIDDVREACEEAGRPFAGVTMSLSLVDNDNPMNSAHMAWE